MPEFNEFPEIVNEFENKLNDSFTDLVYKTDTDDLHHDYKSIVIDKSNQEVENKFIDNFGDSVSKNDTDNSWNDYKSKLINKFENKSIDSLIKINLNDYKLNFIDKK